MTRRHTKALVAAELEQHRQARARRETRSAWRALERAHIVSQAFLRPHLRVHWAMLRLALAERNAGETAGQLYRLALAPLGALTGRIPIGNTGRASVSAFRSMPIPDDLRAAMAGRER